MAEEATKNQSINGGNLVSEVKSLFSILKTKRTMTFAYGFMFAFVVFTAFLAFFSPSSTTSFSPSLFGGTDSGGFDFSNDGSGSRFPFSISYFSPNGSVRRSYPVIPPPLPEGGFPRSSDAAVERRPYIVEKEPPLVKNRTEETPAVNRTADFRVSPPPMEAVKNDTQSMAVSEVGKPNLTESMPVMPTPLVDDQVKSSGMKSIPSRNVSSRAEETNVSANYTASLSKKQKGGMNSVSGEPVPVVATPLVDDQVESSGLNSIPSRNGSSRAEENNVSAANYTASLAKKQEGEMNSVSGELVNQKDWFESLKNCDFFDGEWVMDDSYPLYKPGSCLLIDQQFNCHSNGRPDKDHQKLRWKPKGCDLPRLNGSRMLDMLKGKRLVFVGDSLNRNMWESLVCILRNSVEDKTKVFEVHGRQVFRKEAAYSFVFEDYNFTVEFFASPFLVREWEMPDENGKTKETLRLDLIGKTSDHYKGADIIVFNTGHWWTHDKTTKGKGYYQEGSHVYEELNVLEAFRKAITTWSSWVDKNINPMKSIVFFRGYSESHFSGGQWNSGGQCDSETVPIKNETFLKPYPSKMVVLEEVLRGMKTRVTYLNITKMTDFRKDGHPSIYRKQNLTEEERRSPMRIQDCSHWCLPGVPDTWNEILFAELLLKQQQQK